MVLPYSTYRCRCRCGTALDCTHDCTFSSHFSAASAAVMTCGTPQLGSGAPRTTHQTQGPVSATRTRVSRIATPSSRRSCGRAAGETTTRRPRSAPARQRTARRCSPATRGTLGRRAARRRARPTAACASHRSRGATARATAGARVAFAAPLFADAPLRAALRTVANRRADAGAALRRRRRRRPQQMLLGAGGGAGRPVAPAAGGMT